MDNGETLHATAVAIAGGGVLMIGASGSGKSALALRLMALGAGLIADDRVHVFAKDGTAFVGPLPQTLPAIEARGIGILRADLSPAAPLRLVVDMDAIETARLPDQRRINLAGHDIPCIHNLAQGHFPAAILQYMHQGLYLT